MALFLVIIALLFAFFTLDSIVLGGRRRVFPVLLFLPILFLLFLAIRLDRLIGAGRSGGLAIGLLCFLESGFLSTGFLGRDSLGLHLRRSIVG